MLGTLKQLLKALSGLLASKKALMAILSAVVWLVGKIGWQLDTESLAGAVAPLWAYIFAQGRADQGKEAAKIDAMPLEPNPYVAPEA